MRVRIRRFTENDTEILALDFPLSRAEDGSTLCATPTGVAVAPWRHFTHFVCTVVPLSEAFGLLCSSCELLIVLILSMFSPSRKKTRATMASADPCRLNLTSLSELLVSRTTGLPG